MIVGLCTIEMILYDVNSLKEKRQIIKSLMGRIKSRYNVSIAEVDKHDVWNQSIVGFAYVGNGSKHVDKGIQKVISFIDGDYRVEISNKDIEIL